MSSFSLGGQIDISKSVVPTEPEPFSDEGGTLRTFRLDAIPPWPDTSLSRSRAQAKPTRGWFAGMRQRIDINSSGAVGEEESELSEEDQLWV